MHPSNYRLYFLLTTLKFLAPPLVLAAAFCAAYTIPNRSLRLLIHVFSVPLYWGVNVQLRRYHDRQAAHNLGAVLAPEVCGRWPGNIDIMLRFENPHVDYVVSRYADFVQPSGRHVHFTSI